MAPVGFQGRSWAHSGVYGPSGTTASCRGLNRSHPGHFQSLFRVWHIVPPSSRAVHGAAQQPFLLLLFQKQLKACSHSYKVLMSESLRCLNPKSSWVGGTAAAPRRWRRRWERHGRGGGTSLGILREHNPSPNSSERLLKDPVYRLAKHPGLPSNKIHPVQTDANRGLTDLKHNDLWSRLQTFSFPFILLWEMDWESAGSLSNTPHAAWPLSTRSMLFYQNRCNLRAGEGFPSVPTTRGAARTAVFQLASSTLTVRVLRLSFATRIR